MMQAIVSWLLSAGLGALTAFLRDLLSDKRTAQAQRDLGAAESRAAATEAVLSKEREYAEIDAAPADRASAAGRMRDGTF